MDITNVRMMGVSWQADVYTSMHSHDFYELTYYTDGKGIEYVEGREYNISPGSVVLMAPGTKHKEYLQTVAESRCVCFSTEEVLPEGVCQDTDGKIDRVLCEMQAEQAIKAYGYEKMVAAKMTELKILVERAFCQFTSDKKSDFVYDAVKYLEENYYKKIIMQNIAADLNYSYGYFQHIFKDKIGVSPQQFLIKKRVEAAKGMLAVNGMSCTEIAFACGFATSTQMSVIFKKQTGMSPSEYRNKLLD